MLAEKTLITDMAPDIMADGECRLCAYQIARCFVPCVGHVWCTQLIVL